MLVLGCKVGETIVIDDGRIVLTVCDVRERNGVKSARIGIDAPRDVPVHRGEVWLAIQNEKGLCDEHDARAV